MIDFENLPEEMPAKLKMAKAVAVTEAGVTLILPGQTEATQKSYRRLKGSDIQAGDMVVAAKISGTWVVLDAIL